MKVERFEDLIAWQKARVLTNRIYELTRTGDFARDFSLRDQIRRSAVSIMANIAEGFDRHGLNEFHQFLSIAKASCAELRSHLYIALDANFISNEVFNQVLSQSVEVIRLVAGLRTAVDSKRCNT